MTELTFTRPLYTAEYEVWGPDDQPNGNPEPVHCGNIVWDDKWYYVPAARGNTVIWLDINDLLTIRDFIKGLK